MLLAPSSVALARMKVVGARLLPISLSPPLRTWLASMVIGVVFPPALITAPLPLPPMIVEKALPAGRVTEEAPVRESTSTPLT